MKHFIFIDKKKLNKAEKDAGRIFGSMAKMCEEGIYIKGKKINSRQLSRLMGAKKFFDNENYFIQKREVERMKMKKLK
jgi:hypothetical protein